MTIELADCENIAVDIDESRNAIVFSAMSGDTKYSLNMELFKKIVKDESKWNLKGRNVLLMISKADKEEEEWWPRLTKDKTKNQLITIDWARWKDPDDDDAGEEKPGMGDFDPSMMQGMGGMGGMGGGMPGMGGAGGMGGMDMASLMKQMGGMGGMGGAGGMDMAEMMKNMGGMGGMGGDSDDEEGEESHVQPHGEGEVDDLDQEEEQDLKK